MPPKEARAPLPEMPAMNRALWDVGLQHNLSPFTHAAQPLVALATPRRSMGSASRREGRDVSAR